MSAVYFDNNATTPLDPRVAEAMIPWLTAHHGNPSSIHSFGRAAREAVEEARAAVAELLGARPVEVVFTGSGTEANNAVLAAIGAAAGHHGHVVLSAFEHPSVRAAVEELERRGMEATRIAPGPDGVVSAAAIEQALRPDTRLVCLMLANNEVGTLQPVAEVAGFCRARGIPVSTDAVQAAGKVALDVAELGVDYLTIGAHKFHGPLGAAALWVRPGAVYGSLLVGGSQERRRRAGTENVAAIVGLGRIAELVRRELPERCAKLLALRDHFEAGLASFPDTVVHCQGSPRLPHTSHAAFLGLEAESLLIRLDLAGFAVSTGSACSAGVVEPSKTLLAMGLSPREALSSLRISFGMMNELAEVDAFLAALARERAALARVAPLTRSAA